MSKVIALAAAVMAAATGVVGAQEASVERGQYLVTTIGACGNCHTPRNADGTQDQTRRGAGGLLEQSEAYTAIAPNITPAGRVAQWTDEELARAIREGIRPDGSVIGPPMPFEFYRHISDTDVASIVMYMRTVPAVENDPGTSTYNIPLPPAWGPPITEPVTAPAAGVTAEYGEYLASVGHCMACHSLIGPMGPMLDTHLGSGGNEFEGPWGVSVSANLTPTNLAQYTDEQVVAMIGTGIRPDGTAMAPPMPYGAYARMAPEDLQAVVAYLRGLPPVDMP